MRKKLLSVLSESGKTSTLIDDISVVKRYASDSSHAIPVTSDEEALAKTTKEVDVLTGSMLYLLLYSFLIVSYS